MATIDTTGDGREAEIDRLADDIARLREDFMSRMHELELHQTEAIDRLSRAIDERKAEEIRASLEGRDDERGNGV